VAKDRDKEIRSVTQLAFSTTSTKWRVLWKYKVIREIFKSLDMF
jgi:hypothetical protein